MSTYYYETGIKELLVYYQSKASWECQNPECRVGRDYLQGNFVTWSEKCETKTISINERLIIETLRKVRLHKGCTALCPSCKQKLTYLGWYVWVEDRRQVKALGKLMGFKMETGAKTKESKYCKTLKSRRLTIDRLIKKYGA